MRVSPNALELPTKDIVINERGLVSEKWEKYLRQSENRLAALGEEKAFQLVNNQVAAADVEGLSFDKAKVSCAVVHYVIQRVTTGGGATESLETGCFHVVYKPTADSWSLVTMWTPGPDASGITLSITSAGQVQYVSSSITGTASISKISWRAQVLAAKHSSYSEVGR